jgi:hypothetical protein
MCPIRMTPEIIDKIIGTSKGRLEHRAWQMMRDGPDRTEIVPRDDPANTTHPVNGLVLVVHLIRVRCTHPT